MTRDPWKLVTDESRLRAGMTVELRPCIWCGKNETVMLLYAVRASGTAHAPDGTPRKHNAVKAWRVASRCLSDKIVVFDKTVKEGRIYEASKSSD